MSIILLVITVLASPFAFVAFLLGYAGSVPIYTIIATFGYLGIFIFSIVSIFRYKFFIGIIVSIILMITSLSLDARYWDKQNAALCADEGIC